MRNMRMQTVHRKRVTVNGVNSKHEVNSYQFPFIHVVKGMF